MRTNLALLVSVLFLVACDRNSTYGEDTGVPKNCRAIVQANIDAYRAQSNCYHCTATAAPLFSGLLLLNVSNRPLARIVNA